MTAPKIVVIGGSAAGAKAAARAKRLDQNAEVTLIQKDPELSMASCGYPYYVEGVFEEREKLISTPTGVIRDPAFFNGAKGITALVNTEATTIDRTAKTVTIRSLISDNTDTIAYDKLILCTGSTPRRPPIPGSDLKGIHGLNSLADATELRALVDAGQHKNAVILGGGLIGIETSEALTQAGMKVTIIERLPHILRSLDPELAAIAAAHMTAKGVDIITGVGIAEFQDNDGNICAAKLENGQVIPCDFAVISAGVAPNVELARDAGLLIGETGGIVVTPGMVTSDPDILAAGDCAEVTHRITGKKTLAPYGDLANLQGRVAADNAILGAASIFPGTIDSGICKIFDISSASTGLSEDRARAAGFDVTVAINASPDKPFFMGADIVVSKMVAETKTGRILGFQCIGPGTVSRQTVTAATAIAAGMTVDEMGMLDLPYAPPFSLAIDHSLATAHILQNKLRGLMSGITSIDMKARLEATPRPYILDVRAPNEFEEMRLGIGEKLIPLGMLRKRLDELPQDKDAEIIVYCKVSMRGYEAQQVLRHNGYTNVQVMEGGIMAWPFAREK